MAPVRYHTRESMPEEEVMQDTIRLLEEYLHWQRGEEEREAMRDVQRRTAELGILKEQDEESYRPRPQSFLNAADNSVIEQILEYTNEDDEASRSNSWPSSKKYSVTRNISDPVTMMGLPVTQTVRQMKGGGNFSSVSSGYTTGSSSVSSDEGQKRRKKSVMTKASERLVQTFRRLNQRQNHKEGEGMSASANGGRPTSKGKAKEGRIKAFFNKRRSKIKREKSQIEKRDSIDGKTAVASVTTTIKLPDGAAGKQPDALGSSQQRPNSLKLSSTNGPVAAISTTTTSPESESQYVPFKDKSPQEQTAVRRKIIKCLMERVKEDQKQGKIQDIDVSKLERLLKMKLKEMKRSEKRNKAQISRKQHANVVDDTVDDLCEEEQATLLRNIVLILREHGDKQNNLPEQLLSTLVADATYDNFSRTIETVTYGSSDTGWAQIGAVFQITKYAMSLAGKGGAIANQIKNISYHYIENTFASWLVGQGGWGTVMIDSETTTTSDSDMPID